MWSWSIRSNAAARSASSTHRRCGLLALGGLVDGLDRVMAATARPKPIGPRLEPCLPLGLQRAHDTRLQHAVEDHGDTERAPLPAALLRDVHPPDRTGPLNGSAGAAPSRPSSPWPPGSAPPRRQCPPSSGQRCARVTRRTLTSVLARERSINFCRLRTLFRSPACDAVKIRCRRRRTLCSQARQSTASQVEDRVLWSVRHD